MQITVRSASCTRDKNRIYQITFRNHRQKKGRKKHLQKSFQRRRRVTSSSSSLSPRDRTQKPTEKLLEKKTQIKYCHRQSNTSTSPFPFLPPLKTPKPNPELFRRTFCAISRVYSFHFILINLQLLIRDFYIRNKNMARRWKSVKKERQEGNKIGGAQKHSSRSPLRPKKKRRYLCAFL